MKPVIVISLFALLAACGTPQEQCINRATRDIRVVDGLIAEVEGNLARGYAFEQVTTFVGQFLDCTPRPTEEVPDPAPRQCFEQVPVTTSEPVAIDLNAEAAKLSGLRAKRAQQMAAAGATIDACRVAHPA